MSSEDPRAMSAGDLESLADHAVDLVARLPGPVGRVRIASAGAEIEVEWAMASAPTDLGTSPLPPHHDSPGPDVSGPCGLAALPAGGPASTSEVSAQPGTVVISSPLVGVFYDRPAPDEPAFVEVGDQVTAGQQVAVVEAMKLMNPILTEVGGEVVAIRAASGDAVQFDQALIAIRPLEV